MRTRLILVEGIPGSGKSTAAKHIEQIVKESGFPCHAYLEGRENPADLAWHAYMSLDKMRELMAQYPSHAASIQQTASTYQDHAIIPYLTFLDHDDPLFAQMESYEVYDGRVDAATFQALHQSRWERFAQVALAEESVSVLECALMQNHFNEYCLFHQWPYGHILNAINHLLDAAAPLQPCLIYLAPNDPQACIQAVSKERAWSGGSWAERVTQYLLDSPYGKDHNWTVDNAMIRYFTFRQAQEIQMLPELHAKTHIVRYDTEQWDAKMAGIRAALNRWLSI